MTAYYNNIWYVLHYPLSDLLLKYTQFNYKERFPKGISIIYMIVISSTCLNLNCFPMDNILIDTLMDFHCILGNFPAISDDLVNSYHLLLCCLDLIYSNALFARHKKDLINPSFEGNILLVLFYWAYL